MRLTISGDPVQIGNALRNMIEDGDADTTPTRDHWFQEACRTLRNNDRKIDAIKCWRGYYGVGLMAAKTAVEAL